MQRFSTLLLLLSPLLWSCGPKAKFTYDQNQKLVAPVEVVFTNQSKKAESFQWEFEEGALSEYINPSYRFPNSGVYEVALYAKKGKKISEKRKKIEIEAPETCLIEISTEMGHLLVVLHDATPLHRNNFTRLVEEGFYNDLLFHRVINGFMIQGGDPNSRNAKANASLGSGGPGYTLEAEFVDTLFHRKGALAAARMGDAVNPDKESSGSQFYIVQGRPISEGELIRMENSKGFYYSPSQKEIYMKEGGTPFLDREYTVFGQVIQGLEVIDKIAGAKTNGANRPLQDISMKIRVVK
jgi:cyclophilin family peptidyl-prolyl cis-trans isomerase